MKNAFSRMGRTCASLLFGGVLGAGAMFGAAAVIHLDELYLMGRLSGISAVQDHLERTLAEVDVYVDYAV